MKKGDKVQALVDNDFIVKDTLYTVKQYVSPEQVYLEETLYPQHAKHLKVVKDVQEPTKPKERLLLLPNGYKLYYTKGLNPSIFHGLLYGYEFYYGRLQLDGYSKPQAWYHVSEHGIVVEVDIEKPKEDTTTKDIVQHMVDIVDDHEDKSVDEVFGIDDIKKYVRQLQDIYCK